MGDRNAVAVMLDAGVVVGHDCGRLGVWSSKDGSFQRVCDNKNKLGSASCTDISADENIAVTGHKDGTVVVWEVWETRTWTVRRVLKGHLAVVDCVAVVMREGNRISSVDGWRELRVWDTSRGDPKLCVIETDVGRYHFISRAFVSSDAGTSCDVTYFVPHRPPFMTELASTSRGRRE